MLTGANSELLGPGRTDNQLCAASDPFGNSSNRLNVVQKAKPATQKASFRRAYSAESVPKSAQGSSYRPSKKQCFTAGTWTRAHAQRRHQHFCEQQFVRVKAVPSAGDSSRTCSYCPRPARSRTKTARFAHAITLVHRPSITKRCAAESRDDSNTKSRV